MDVGDVERLGELFDELLERRLTLGCLHAVAERSLEGCTMARHIELWDQQHMVLTTVVGQLPCLGERVVLPRVACHTARGIELREALRLDAPGLVLRQVPVEDIDLEGR